MRLIKYDTSNHKSIHAEKKIIFENISIHWHNFYEIDFFASGTGSMQFNDSVYEIRPGLICLAGITDFHKIYMSSKCCIYNLQFSEDFLIPEQFPFYQLREIGALYLNPQSTKTVEELFRLLIMEIDRRQPHSEICIHHLTELLLYHLLRHNQNILSIKNVSGDTISHAVEYLNTHFRENPPMSKVAEMYFLNANYFSTLFSKKVGKTYREYLRELRLQYACKLLKITDLQITEICYAAGYNSLSNFLREFKKYYGCSPSQIRDTLHYWNINI